MKMEVSHSQIAVFDATLEEPFNDWNDNAVDEGSSANERSVSFATPTDGTARIAYEIGTDVEPIDAAYGRTLRGTIEIAGGQGIEIATITQSHAVEAENGRYEVEYGVRMDGEAMDMRFAITRLREDRSHYGQTMVPA